MANVDQPTGVFASAGALDDAVVSNSAVKGVLIRVFWRDLETSPGTFNWAAIDNQLTALRLYGRQWSLAVLGGSFAPTWLYGAPFNVPSMALTFQGQPVTVPKFWHAGLQARLASLANALAARYGSDEKLALVYVPQMTLNGVEGHFNGVSGATLTAAGYTDSVWSTAVLQAAQAFATAFPAKPLAVELHEINSSQAASQQIMSGINAGALKGQVGVAVWWMSGKTTYQANLLASIAGFSGAKYVQFIDKSENAASFEDSDFTTAFDQSKQIGAKYIEPWGVDVKLPQWSALLSDFNNYSSPLARSAPYSRRVVRAKKSGDSAR